VSPRDFTCGEADEVFDRLGGVVLKKAHLDVAVVGVNGRYMRVKSHEDHPAISHLTP
jgi:hypothetical protein